MNCSQLDRFIPNRSAMDCSYAHYMLTEGRKIKEKHEQVAVLLSRETYRKRLAKALNKNYIQILAFKNKAPAPVELFPKDFFSPPPSPSKSSKPRCYIPQVYIPSVATVIVTGRRKRENKNGVATKLYLNWKNIGKKPFIRQMVFENQI